jgi:predicted  nucleic acid-binding Zn-ribbon protein
MHVESETEGLSVNINPESGTLPSEEYADMIISITPSFGVTTGSFIIYAYADEYYVGMQEYTITVIYSEVQEFVYNLEALSERIELTESQINDLNGEINSTLEDYYNVIEEEDIEGQQELLTELTILEDQLNNFEDTLDDLEDDYHDLEDNYEDIDNNDFIDAGYDPDVIEEELDLLNENINELEDYVSSLEQEIDSAREIYLTVEDFIGALNNLRTDVSNLRLILERLNENIELTSNSYYDAVERNDEDDIHDAEENLEELEDDLNDVMEFYNDLNDDSINLWTHYYHFEVQHFADEGYDANEIKTELEDLDNEINDIYYDMIHLQLELDSATEIYSYELCYSNLYLGGNISNCELDAIREDDFGLLADGIFNDLEGMTDNYVSYAQTINFQNQGTGQFTFTQDDEDAPVAQSYIFIDNSNQYLYNYSLTFDEPVEYDSTSEETAQEDLVGTTIEIQGETYTIVDVDLSETSSINEIGFLPGIRQYTNICDYSIELLNTYLDTTSTFNLDETEANFNAEDSEPSEDLNVLVHFTALESTSNVEVEAELINSEGTLTRYNDYSDEVIAGESYIQELILSFPGGMDTEEVYTLQVYICPESGDCVTATYDVTINVDETNCELGTDKITIHQGDETQYNNADVDGSLSLIDSTPGQWNGFNIVLAPDTDEVYLTEGDSFIDPVFGKFMLTFESIEEDDYEEIELVAGSTSAELRFTNNDGTEVTLPLAADSASQTGETSNESIYWGTEAPTSTTPNQDELVYLEGETCQGSTNVVDCQGAMFLVIDDGLTTRLTAHLIQITNINTDDNTINFDDLTYGTTNDNIAYIDGAANTISLTSAGDIGLTIDETTKTITFTELGSNVIVTSNYGVIQIINTDLSSQIFEGFYFTEYNTGIIDTYLTTHLITAIYDDLTDNTIEIQPSSVSVLGSADGYGMFDLSDENDNTQKFMTYKGTLLTYDRENQQYLIIQHSVYPIYAVLYLESVE